MNNIEPSRRRLSGSGESRIPVPSSPSPLRRFGTCPPIQEQSPVINRHRSLQSLTTTPLRTRLHSDDHDDDLDSLNSYGSCASAYSTTSQCDHASFARNGTTYSGRRRRYVVHCSPHSTPGDEYLTPTQRASRTIRKLKAQLSEAQAEIEEKDRQLFRLTKEVVQLRLLKVDSGTEVVEPDSSCRLSDPNTLPSPSQEEGLSPQTVVDLPPSLADSGHFEDLANGKDWLHRPPVNRDLEVLQRQHEDVIRDLKEKQNDRVDALLLRITGANDRYYELRPKLETQQNRIKELEEENETLKRNWLEAQSKLEILNSENNQLRLNVQTVENKVQELEMLNNRLQIEKSECDHTTNQKLEKRDENFESLNKYNNELETRLSHLLNQNEELKQQIIDISKAEKSEVDHGILEEEHENIDNLKKCYADLEIQFQNILKQNEELKLKNNHLSECIGELKKVNDTPKDVTETSRSADNCDVTSTDLNIVKIEELEKEIQNLKLAQKEQEEHHKNVYLEMYKKGQEAAKFEFTEGIDAQQDGETNEKTSHLMKKLEITQAELENVKVMYKRILETKKPQPDHDPEMTLQFLKSAIYYFLTDKENCHGHLAAIESILGFTELEKVNIDKAYLWR